MNEIDELLPCPFCGGEASVRLYYKGRYAVHCDSCDAHMKLSGTRAEAIEAWNTRQQPKQAIEATLGRGTCHTVPMDCFGNPPYNQSGLNGNSTACGCSECGTPWSTCGLFRGNALHHNFKACPICGRRVVEVDG